MRVALLLILLQTASAATLVTVAQGTASALTSPRTVVVQDSAAWVELWKAHGLADSPPPVNFATETVAAVFLGTRPTSGFRVDITGTRVEGNQLVIEFVETRPSSRDKLAPLLTSPFHIVRFPRQAGAVVFRRIESTTAK